MSEEVEIWDTRTGQLDDLLNDKLKRAFDGPTHLMLHDLARIAIEHDPIDLAHAASRLPQSMRPILYENLPDLHAKITFLTNTGNNTRSVTLRNINEEEIVRLLEGMPTDEAVWLLDDMSSRLYKRVIDKLKPEKATAILELHKHDRESAGRLMTNEFFAFPPTTTIGEVAQQIRAQPGIDLTRCIFVIDEKGELAGFVPARNLIINEPTLPIRSVMRPVMHYVSPDSSRDEVVDVMERYDISALPVLNEHGQIAGVIAFEDAVEAMKDILDDTIASIAGTVEDVSEHDPIIKRLVWRAPWLVVTLFSGLTTATCMGLFRESDWFLFLGVAFFVPLIAGMSGNVGIQCSTLMVRSMSSGELTSGNRRETAFKELVIGGLIGLVFGVLSGCVIYMLQSFYPEGPDHATPLMVSAVVACGLFGACLNASAMGTYSPFFFARMNIDPAVAAGPIVTAFNDVTSTLMFFLIAYTLSTYLF